MPTTGHKSSTKLNLSNTNANSRGASGKRRPRFPQPRRGVTDLLYTYSILWALLLEVLVFSLLEPNSFFTTANLHSILGSQAMLLMVAIGLTVPLAVNEFDLSIGSMVSFSQVLLGALAVKSGWPLLPAILATVAACALVGLVNAILVVRVGVGSFIATLGSGTLLMGLAILITNSQPIAEIPAALTTISTNQIFGIQLVFWYGLAGVFVLWYVLSQTTLGRWLYFAGANPEAARLNGVPVARLRSGALVVSATVAGIAGIFYSGVFGTADPISGEAFLLPAFAAAFLGATAVDPGRFNAWGTFLSVFLVSVGIVGLSFITGQVGWISFVFNGGVLVIAVAAQRLVAVRREKKEVAALHA